MIEITDKVKMSKAFLNGLRVPDGPRGPAKGAEAQVARFEAARGTVVDVVERGDRPAEVFVLWDDGGRSTCPETDLVKA